MVKKLITFGCSWTYGVGVNYHDQMTEQDYKETAWNKNICDEFSFRGLLSKKYNLENINFSTGGSPNQKQFMEAEQFLPKYNDKDTVVLWGLTSVYRYYMYDSKKKCYESLFLGNQNSFNKIMLSRVFDYDNEIARLEQKMLFFNDYFDKKGIRNFWYNTFNKHEYKNKFDNVLFNGEDLLSIMINDFDDNSAYHKSDWCDTDKKILQAKKMGLVNPITLHPTKQAHKIISEHFEKEITL